MLKTGVKHYYLHALHDTMLSIGLFRHVPWLFPFFKKVPILNMKYHTFWNWIDVQVANRRKVCIANQ